MSIEYSWDRCFSPAEAERGKFLPIDTPTLTSFGYPLTGRGKYAEMVYLVNPEDVMISVSGLVFNISGVSIDEPVTIDYITHTAPISGSVSIIQPNTLYIASSTIDDKAHIFTPSQSLQLLEIFNKTSEYDAYVMLSATSFDNLTAWGMPIVAGAYYSVETEVDVFTVGSELTADLRIMGHYRT